MYFLILMSRYVQDEVIKNQISLVFNGIVLISILVNIGPVLVSAIINAIKDRRNKMAAKAKAKAKAKSELVAAKLKDPVSVPAPVAQPEVLLNPLTSIEEESLASESSIEPE